MSETINGLPAFACESNGTQLFFRCPYCKRDHYHGHTTDKPVHRVGHCKAPGSPLGSAGYYVYPREVAADAQ